MSSQLIKNAGKVLDRREIWYFNSLDGVKLVSTFPFCWNTNTSLSFSREAFWFRLIRFYFCWARLYFCFPDKDTISCASHNSQFGVNWAEVLVWNVLQIDKCIAILNSFRETKLCLSVNKKLLIYQYFNAVYNFK